MPDDTPQSRPKLSSWLPYVMSGLSYIPLLGIFPGIAAIGWGFFLRRTEGWKIVWIGAGGVVCTALLVACYWLTEPVVEDNKADEISVIRGHTEVAVKVVEFYKLTHSHYPKSMKDVAQAIKREHRHSSYDPAALELARSYANQTAARIYYQVEPDEQSYYLFAVGADQKPFTADDIVPDFPESELKCLGLKIPSSKPTENL